MSSNNFLLKRLPFFTKNIDKDICFNDIIKLIAGDNMNRKEEAVKLINTKLNGETFLNYKEIAEIITSKPTED